MNAPIRKFVESEPAPSGRFEVSVARTMNDLMQVMTVRTLVYMGEQVCPYDEEFDGNDFAGATHLILRCDGEPVGCVRMRWFADFVKLERLAIRREYRSLTGLMMLAREAVKIAERKGYRRLMGHAQPRIVPFWRRYFNAKPRAGRDAVAFSDHSYVEMEFPLNPPADAITPDTDPMVLLRPEGDWDRPGILDKSLLRPVSPAAAPAFV